MNLAASVLPSDEAYLEVGSWRGLSIIAAVLGNQGRTFYAIESFRGFGVDRRKSEAELLANLNHWGVSNQVTLIVDNAFRALRRPDLIAEPIGVLFYDGSHDRLAQYLALGMSEPHLADRALVIIDDSSRAVVSRTTDKYVHSHLGYTLLFDMEARQESDPRWWNGVRVYAFDRGRSVPESEPPDLKWRRLLYLHAYEPATWAVARSANRTLSKYPRLMSVARRLAGRMQPKVRTRRPA